MSRENKGDNDMTNLPKDKWNQLDDLLNDAGACGYTSLLEEKRC